MNREDVIRMAREAGFVAETVCFRDTSFPSWLQVRHDGPNGCLRELELFAAMVAAAERRKHQADIEHWKAQAAQAEKWRSMAHARHCDGEKVVQEIQREAMELEREACAKACESVDLHDGDFLKDSDPRKTCAATIRARSQS